MGGLLGHSLFAGALGPDVASGQYVLTLQVFVAMAALLGLVPAIVLGERDRAMAKLRESEEKFSKAFRTSPNVMSISDLETGRYLEVNEAHEKILWVRREEVLAAPRSNWGCWNTRSIANRAGAVAGQRFGARPRNPSAQSRAASR